MRVLIAIISLLFSASSLSECDDWTDKLEEQYKKASAVYYVKVKSTGNANESTRSDLYAEYDLIRIFKGTMPGDLTLRYGLREESIRLMAGEEYVVFLRNDNFVTICWGSRHLSSGTDLTDANNKRFMDSLEEISNEST